MFEKMRIHTLFLSDTHLGLGEKIVGLLPQILSNNYEFEELALVGDTFEHFDFTRYNKQELSFMTWLFNLDP